MKISTLKLKLLPLSNWQPLNPLMPGMVAHMPVIATLKIQVKGRRLPMELIPRRRRMRTRVRRLMIRDWRLRILSWS